MAVMLLGGVNFAWGTNPTLTNSLQVSGYKAKAYYDFTTNTPAVLPTTENSGNGILTYRSEYGLHNYGSGTRSATATIPVASGDILVVEEYVSSGTFAGGNITINRGTKNATLTSTVNVSTYEVFDITATADDITFTNQRYYSIRAVLVMEEDKTVATPTFTIGSYNYEQGGYAVTPSCATEGATLTYTIGGGAATACTSGVPFYAKDGKLNITASKTGWTSSSLAKDDQWTLNVAPSSSSPETLIPFQKFNDNGDKNIEHVYKSVTIAGGSSGAIAGIVSGDANALKLRTNQSSNTITLNVNSGYTVTRVSIAAKSNNKGATIGLTSTTVDGGSNIMTETTTFPISTAASAVTYDTNGTAINAKNNIVFTFDNRNIDPDDSNKKNYQIQATIKVWYKTPVENAIEDCKAWEISSAFATAIDAESFANVDAVYAFHTQWQVNNGTPSRAILNNEVTSADHWWGNLQDTGADYDGAPDTKYLSWGDAYNVNQHVKGLPAGSYHVSAWTYASAAGYRKLYISKVPDVGDWEDLTAPSSSAAGWVKLEGDFTLTEKTNVAFGFYGAAITSGTTGFDNWTLTKLEPVGTKSGRNYASYVTPQKLDFSAADGITAYIATGLNGSSDAVVLKSVDIVPAGEPIIVKTDTKGATVNVPVTTADASDVSGNNLVAGDGTTAWNGTAGYTYYYLASDQFHEATGGTLQSGKAYLKVANGGSARQLSIVFGDDEATGIADVRGKKEDVNGNFFDLSGRKVAQPTKGLYIVNGKKVIIK